MTRKYVYQDVVVRKSRLLPHWHVPRGLYFVTWRLAGSLTQEQERTLSDLRLQLDRARTRDYYSAATAAIEREIFRLTERDLDQGYGSAFMNTPEIADLVVEALLHGNGSDYRLITHTVMPNHVHVVMRLDAALDVVIQRWKSFTAHEGNKLLGRRGKFWEDDYFDVLIRDAEQLETTVSYVRNNPLKAELRNWTWSGFWAEAYAELL